jgi:cytochrome d ubiquinol oxidase subunit II
MGAVAGGIASGRVPAGGTAGDPVDSWINPTSIVTGVLAVVAVAYLAAVYLVWEARRDGDEELAEYFRRRALVSAIAVAVVAVLGMVLLHSDAPYVFDGMTGRALPVVLVGVACGLGALVLLARDINRGARVLAVLAVAGIVVAWGVAQWPYLLPESLTISEAAAPSGTLRVLILNVVLAVLIVLPGFVLLFVLAQRRLLPEEGVPDAGDRAVEHPGG